jgi:hypothetical protein
VRFSSARLCLTITNVDRKMASRPWSRSSSQTTGLRVSNVLVAKH